MTKTMARLASAVRGWQDRRAIASLTDPFPSSKARMGERNAIEREEVFALKKDPVTWTIPAGYRVEGHGHSFVLINRRSERLADLTIEANAPVQLRYSTNHARITKSCEVALTGAPDTAVKVHVGERRVIDRGVGKSGSGWKVWHGPRSLTYFLEEPLSEEGKSTLCVAFSAIGPPYNFTYNYKSALADVDAYRIYLLDNFGSRGSYYYADHRDESIYSAVQSFLKEIAETLNIAPSNMVFLGSSKGGTAALAHGLPLGAGRIIAGAPQCFPGRYLKRASPEILDFIAGSSSVESAEWLDQLIPNAIENVQGDPHITVLVGENDGHRRVHVEPLNKMAKSAGIRMNMLVVEKLSHQEVGVAFGPYVKAILRTERDLVQEVVPYRFKYQAKSIVELKLWMPSDEVAAVELWTPSGCILDTGYSSENLFRLELPSQQPINARIRRKKVASNTEIGSFTTGWFPARSMD